MDTYRILGKAFLERQRYSDAADMFMRVLAIYPDDFVAHIGISIVREEQSDLDHAVFHMERAFEVQPTNTAIQDELKRLYAKRDGVAPAKIRLTHPALARLYSKGDLTDQALGELTVALTDSPNRSDILAQLAEIQIRENLNSEAIETCNKLIESLPYCFGALNVLTRLLPGTPSAQEASVFQARINELDPYFEFKSNTSQSITDVSDDAVMIEPMVWSPESEIAVNKSDWSSEIAMHMVDPYKYDASDILRTIEDTSHDTEVPTQPFKKHPVKAPLQPVNPSDELPAWMESAGWSKSGETTEMKPSDGNLEKTTADNSKTVRSKKDKSANDFSTEEKASIDSINAIDSPEAESTSGVAKPRDDTDSLDAEGKISPASIPDWLQTIAPPEETPVSEGIGVGVPGISDKVIDDAFSSIFPTRKLSAKKLDGSKQGFNEETPPESKGEGLEETVQPVADSESSEGLNNIQEMPVQGESFNIDDLRKEMEPVEESSDASSSPVEESSDASSSPVELRQDENPDAGEYFGESANADLLDSLRKAFPTGDLRSTTETSAGESPEQTEDESVEENVVPKETIIEEPSEQPEEPKDQVEKPVMQAEEPLQQVEEPASQSEEPVIQAEAPIEQFEEPVMQAEEPMQQVEELASQSEESEEQGVESVMQAEEPMQQVEEPEELGVEPVIQAEESMQQVEEPQVQAEDPLLQKEDQLLKPESEIPVWLHDNQDKKEETVTDSSSKDASQDELPAWLQDFEQKMDQQAESGPILPSVPGGEEGTQLGSTSRPDAFLNWGIPDDSSSRPKSQGEEFPELPRTGQKDTNILPELSPDQQDIDEQSYKIQPEETQQEPSPDSSSENSPATEPVPTSVKDEEDEAPAWLAKLAGIDDMDMSSSISEEEPASSDQAFQAPESLSEIIETSQPEKNIDYMPGTDTTDQDLKTEPPTFSENAGSASMPPVAESIPAYEETTLPDTSDEEPVPVPEVDLEDKIDEAPFVEEPLPTPPVGDSSPVESGEDDSVPDLTKIIEGLQSTEAKAPVPDDDVAPETLAEIKPVEEKPEIQIPETEPEFPPLQSIPEPGTSTVEKPEIEPGEDETFPDLSKIVDGLQAAIMKDTGPGADADIQPVVETPPIEEKPETQIPESELESPSSQPAPEPSRPVVETPAAEFNESEPVPDLSMIVEGLQAAWMSEQVEDSEIKLTETPADVPAPKPPTGSNDTIIVKRPESETPINQDTITYSAEETKERAIIKEGAPPPPIAKQKEKPKATTPSTAPIELDNILKDARAAYSHGVLDDSLARYMVLINRNRLIDPVIDDLEKMAASRPDISDIWQTLGDAYTRRNKLEQALSAYHKAEGLIK
ncbi:MAG: hypothetical protein JW704_01800 [Anaerolineaceae bacterium]|nr:hypothetical protein [Anaerolineaceae bacterium]